MDVTLESCRCESTRRAEDVRSLMPWETVITITLRSSSVIDDLSQAVADRIGSASMRQFVEEVGERQVGDLDL